ncbi:MAG: hypothetical protein H3C30_02590 [Candidatus Hydrogenedentes bacterium]|nr:hypothetical protein [Candidatus Hydrogenedentota bacterium]
MRYLSVLMGLGLLAFPALAGEPVQLVVGSENASVVRELLTLDLAAGQQELAHILPNTVLPESVFLRDTAPENPVRVVTQRVLSRSPEGAAPFMEAVWLVDAPAAGPRTLELTHIVQSVKWGGQYHLVASPEGGKAVFQAEVFLRNGSRHHFQNLSVSLGNAVQEGSGESAFQPCLPGIPAPPRQDPAGVSLEGLCPLPLLKELPPDSSVSMPLASLAALPVRVALQCDLVRTNPYADYDYSGGRPGGSTPMWVLEADNTVENGLGMALPKGKARVYRNTGAGMAFWGAATVEGAEPGQTLRLVVAPEPAVTVVKGFAASPDQGRTGVQTLTIKIRNGLKETREVRLYDQLQRQRSGMGGQAEIQEASDLYKMLDDGRVEFRVTLNPGEERVITYTVRGI